MAADKEANGLSRVYGSLGERVLSNIQSTLLIHQREVVSSGYFAWLNVEKIFESIFSQPFRISRSWCKALLCMFSRISKI